MINVSGKSCRENKDTDIMFKTFPKNCTIYKIMWKNMVEPQRPQMTQYSAEKMQFACWITKA